MKGCHQGRLGLTLIELLLVIGIIAVLAGIIWCVFAPVRERARQAVCLGNLRQVWLALQAYRDDHEGLDPDGTPKEFWELGLPDSICVLVETGYIKNVWVARCPNDLALVLGHDPKFPQISIHPTLYVSYRRGWWDDRDPVMKRRGMKFRDWVAQQGMNMVAVWESHHDENAQRHRWPEDDRYFALWVTLQGSVHRGWYDIPGEDPKPPTK
jgi:prepilin-type N-terminal cleavage/methylation domain-containing protein